MSDIDNQSGSQAGEPPTEHSVNDAAYLSALFTAGRSAVARQDWATARSALAQLVRADPSYRQDGQLAVALLAEVEQHLQGTALPRQADAPPLQSRSASARSANRTPSVIFGFVALIVILLIALFFLFLTNPNVTGPLAPTATPSSTGTSTPLPTSTPSFPALAGRWSNVSGPEECCSNLSSMTPLGDSKIGEIVEFRDDGTVLILPNYGAQWNWRDASHINIDYSQTFAGGPLVTYSVELHADTLTLTSVGGTSITFVKLTQEAQTATAQAAVQSTQAAVQSTQAAVAQTATAVAASGLIRKMSVGGQVHSVAFSPDGQTLASGSGDYSARPGGNSGGQYIVEDKQLQLWRVADGTLLTTLDTIEYPVLSVAFSPDGQTLASGSSDNIVLWRVADGTLQRTIEDPYTSNVWSVAFSPDGKTLASASEIGPLLWQLADGTFSNAVAYLRAYSVAFSPDGKTLASASEISGIQLWRVDDGTLLQTFEGHTDAVDNVHNKARSSKVSR